MNGARMSDEVLARAQAILDWMEASVARDLRRAAAKRARFERIKAEELAKVKAGRYDRKEGTR